MVARDDKEVDEETQPRQEFKTFEDILTHIGDAGRYQWFLFIILLPFTCAYAFLFFVQYFITLLPEEHWCKVPEFDGTNLTDWQKIDLSVPLKSYDEAEISFAYSRCKMYLTNYTEVLLTGKKPSANTPIGDCQHGWSFNQTTLPYISLAAELEWVCDKTLFSTGAQSIFFVGSIVGGLIYGYFADHYGRKPAMITCNFIALVASVSTAFCNSNWTFFLARFVAGTSFDNSFNIFFIIVMEYVGVKYRTLMVNMSYGVYYSFASSLIPWIAYWISDWRLFCLVTAAPFSLVFLLPWIVPESARWYIQHGRVDDAVREIKKLAKFNKKPVTKETCLEFEKSFKLMKDGTSKNNHSLLDLFKLRRLSRITLVLIANWVLMIFIFDGHIWNMKSMHPNVFISFSLGAISEFPAAIVVNLILDKCGRRWMSFGSMILCAIFSFLALAMPIGAMSLWTAALARLGINVALNICYQQAIELLPTAVRAQGFSLIHIIGHGAHALGSSIIYLADVTPWLPLVLLGSLSLLTAFLTLTLPETTDEQLPDTLEEGNNFGKNQSFWLVPCLKKH